MRNLPTHPAVAAVKASPTYALITGCTTHHAYTLPEAITRNWDALVRLASEPEPDRYRALPAHHQATSEMLDAARAGKPLPWAAGAVVDYRHTQTDRDAWRRARDAAAAYLSTHLLWDGPRPITKPEIIGHLQSALTALLEEFTADRRILASGETDYAYMASPTTQLLLESDEVRRAYVRAADDHTRRYSLIRTVYADLRGGHAPLHSSARPDTSDPLRVTSPLAEIANINDLVPGWTAAARGTDPRNAATRKAGWPWPQTLHCRMAWWVDHGAIVWAPTASQHEAAWQALQPPRPVFPALPGARPATTPAAAR